MADDAITEIRAGDRFAFGANWTEFLRLVNQDRIDGAVESMKAMLTVSDLVGQRFIDIGSGSGLFSLAARRLGAQVVSFDYDPASVACTAELRRRYDPVADGAKWQVLQGSLLDLPFLASLGQFHVVYSWGVLHHTGDMWTALGNVTNVVRPGGRLFISIYNDQGAQSKLWTGIKRRYNSSGALERWTILEFANLYFQTRSLVASAYRALRGHPARRAPRGRGMDRRHDLVDWVGGYPFEVAKPEEIFDFCRSRGFVLQRLKTCGGGLGCNEFVFRRESPLLTEPTADTSGGVAD